MISKRTVLDRMEIDRNGVIGVRLAKEVIDDDGTVLASDFHRTMLPPGLDIDTQMAVVNQHLQQMNCAPVEADELQRIKAVAPIVWTDDVKAAYAARQQAQAEAALGAPQRFVEKS